MIEILYLITKIGNPGYFPPAEFDYTFPGEVVLFMTDEETTRKYCPDYGVACVPPGGEPGKCVIIFNAEYAYDFADIMRHEMGHCNGWSRTHPGAR